MMNSNAVGIAAIVVAGVLGVFFGGDPDLMDAITHWLKSK